MISESMLTRDMIDRIQSVAILKNNWYSIGGIIIEIRNARDVRPSRRLIEVSKICGYNPNTLNRMASVRAFFDNLKISVPEAAAIDANTLSFPSLETVKRLYQADSENGLKMFTKVIHGEITYRELVSKYSEIKTKTDSYSVGYLARKASDEFERIALEYIKKGSVTLFDNNNNLQFSEHRNSEFADVVVTATTETGYAEYGIVFKTLETNRMPSQIPNWIEAFIAKTVLYGNFFDKYWIVFPSDANETKVESFIAILNSLEKESYGVITIPYRNIKKGKMKILKNASGKPVPDLRDKKLLYDEHFRKMRQYS